MLPAAQLTRALRRIQPTTFTGSLFRAVHLKFFRQLERNPQPLYSLGASRSGARFTPVGGPPTLYAAEDYATAYREFNHVALAVQAADPSANAVVPPTVVLNLPARLDAVLDLWDPVVRKALGTNLTELRAPWRRVPAEMTTRRGGRKSRVVRLPPAAGTQRLGKAAFDSGAFQAIRYPSARNPGFACFAIFPRRLRPPAFVEVRDDDSGIRQRFPAL